MRQEYVEYYLIKDDEKMKKLLAIISALVTGGLAVIATASQSASASTLN